MKEKTNLTRVRVDGARSRFSPFKNCGPCCNRFSTPSRHNDTRNANLNMLNNGGNCKVLDRDDKNSPILLQRPTPNQTKLRRVPIKLIVRSDGIYQNHMRIFTPVINYNERYNPNKEVRPYSLSPSRKNTILTNLPYLKKSTIKLVGDFDTDVRDDYRGKRNCFPNQKSIMGNTSAGEYVATAMPNLLGKTNWQWLHLIAFCLGGPNDTGPQDQNNLVAGTAECNYLMLAFERKLKSSISNHLFNTLTITVAATFLPNNNNLFLYTRIAEKIDYTITAPRKNSMAISFYPTTCYGCSKTVDKFAGELVKKILKYFSLPKSNPMAKQLFTPTTSPNPF